MNHTRTIESPIGTLLLSCDELGLNRIGFAEKTLHTDDEHGILDQAQHELEEYFSGKRKAFTVPLHIPGTEFQIRVYQALLQIPYGEVCSYADIARAINNPKAFRAVGLANNRNRIPLIIPCHRVVGSNGALVGYAGGIEKKQMLLELEQQYC